MSELVLLTDQIEAGLAACGIDPPKGAPECMARHLTFVRDWNRAYNLTRVDDPETMVVRHVLDSAVVGPYVQGDNALDVGSGAGFPGLVLALLAPERKWTLIEASGKKCRFLAHVVRKLRLEARVNVVHSRVENFRGEMEFASVVTRALGDLASQVSSIAPILSLNGVIYALKGRYPDAEMSALPAGWHCKVKRLQVPGLQGERHLVICARAPSC